MTLFNFQGENLNSGPRYSSFVAQDFKVSNSRESGLDRHSELPAQPDSLDRKDRSK